MKENYDNLGLIIYFFNGQDAGNNLYIFLTDMKTLISFHFVSSSNIGQILNKVDFFTVLPFFNSIILIIAISFAIPIIQRILCSRFDWTKKNVLLKQKYPSFSENMVLFTQYLLYISKTYVAKISSMFLQDRELGCRKGFLNKKGIQRHQYVCLCCLQK